jgi:osmotically-inducible protein OsmY
MEGDVLSSEIDVQLSLLIKDSLMQDERLSSHEIDVSVVNGITTLSGMVQSYRRKLAAEQIAESLRGCRGVVNKLVVEPFGTVTDMEIAENVRKALDAHADITKEVITVDVKAGVVILQGNVSTHWESLLAEDIALSARGVKNVRNILIIEPAQKRQDESLTRDIQKAFSNTAGLENSEVRVAVNGNKAVLSGHVNELWQKQKTEEVVEKYPVIILRNEISVGGD